MNDFKRLSPRNQDSTSQKIPKNLLGARYKRTTYSYSEGGFRIFTLIMLLLAVAFFILGLYFWSYTTYITVPASSFGGEVEIPLYPYRKYSALLWILAIIFFVTASLGTLKDD